MTISSLIPAFVDQSQSRVPDPDPVLTDLLAVLAQVVDPRAWRGVRHRCAAVLGIAVCAVLAGAKSYRAIAEWAQDLTPAVWERLGLGRRAPCEATIRRLLQSIDAAHLDQLVSAWLSPPAGPSPVPESTGPVARTARRVIALDGKTARGARCGQDRAVHLLSALDTAAGVILGQAVVDGKTNEITAFTPLLDHIDIRGAIITADALHTQRGHAEYLHSRGAHYLLTVKANQPRLLAQLRALPWTEVPVTDVTDVTGHGRRGQRTLRLTAIAAGIGFPGAALALQLTRRRWPLASRKWSTETVHCMTDLTQEQTSPAELADAPRAHWGIENRVHWVRDVTYAEDLSQIRTGHGPAVMATLRNLAISIHRKAGATNIAAATRHLSRHPNRILPLLT